MSKLLRINDSPVRFVRADLVTHVCDDSGYSEEKTVVHLQGGGIVHVRDNVFNVVKKIDAALSASDSHGAQDRP